MYQLIKPFLFLMEPEQAHHFTTRALHFFLRLPLGKSLCRSTFLKHGPGLSKNIWGLTFSNPVGLAAGFDKNAELIDDFTYLGFGFIEIGTVTPKGQPGNPKPRLFRLQKDEALINRMGFNNLGLDEAVRKLKNRKSNIIVGGNIGKNKTTPNEEAVNDYIVCFEGLYPYVDYFVINVSSPNTPGLRSLQDKGPLKAIIEALQDKRRTKEKSKPILLKIAPDLTDEQLDDIAELVDETSLDGLIISNTTISREGLVTEDGEIETIGAGGLSGKPVRDKSTSVLRYIRQKNSTIPIIAVGGIMSADDAKEKIDAGADLLQVYTGLVYKGPFLIKSINKRLSTG